MRKLYSTLLLVLITSISTFAQSYCSPTFANGCFSWHNQSITIGTINWNVGTDCTLNDFTSMSTTVNAGSQVPMTVTSGVWCGAAVWVDFNQDLAFDSTENVYHNYVGGDPSFTYNFNIDIPAGTPMGAYRMRVIGAWGSDGYSSTNMNGFGPCGSFQYGNFVDVTLNVSGPTEIDQLETLPAGLVAYPNPTTDAITLELANSSDRSAIITLYNLDGRVVKRATWTNKKGMKQLDLSELSSGTYQLCYEMGTELLYLRILKR